MKTRTASPGIPRWERLLPGLVCLLCSTLPSAALDVTGFTPAVNDRFDSGYPTAPVVNTSPFFIGAGYDFSGIGWDSTNATKSFALLSPRNYLVARHYGGATVLQFADNSGQLYSYNGQSVQDTGYGVVFDGQTAGDISVGTLATPVAASNNVTSYAFLDNVAYATSTSVVLYGHGNTGTDSPVVGQTTLVGMNTGTGHNSLLATGRANVQLVGGDSGSPDFIKWTDPTGAKQLTIVGNNAAIDTNNNYNILNFLGRQEVITAINSIMAPSGYAMRFVAYPTATLQDSGWSAPFNSTSYLGFDAALTSSRTVTVSTAVRGLIFNPGSSPFTLSSGTLSLGRGGINNYDTHAQNFSSSFILTDSQYWDGHSGGFNVSGDVNTNGQLLITQGSGAMNFSGVLSGTGSLAKDGSGILTLTGSNTYTGKTFLHNGTLLAKNATGSATGTGALTVEAGKLAGFGSIASNTTVQNGAHLTAGNFLDGVATPSLDPLTQSQNALAFTGNLTRNGALDFCLANLSELSGFTQIRLTGSSSLLTLGNTSSLTLSTQDFLGVADPNSSDAFWKSAHSWTLIDLPDATSASGVFSQVDLGTWTDGSFSLSYTGGSASNDITLSYTAVETVPEPSTQNLLAGASILLAAASRKWLRPRVTEKA